MGKIIDMTGQRFGRLQVIKLDLNKKINNKAYFNYSKKPSVEGFDWAD